MSDLISRSELLEELDKYEKELRKDKTEAIETDDEQMLFAITNQETAICRIRRNILHMPTAYNVDTVVAELDKKAKRHGGEDYFVEFGDVVEIVKQGGITYDCNNCANYTEPDEIDNGCYLCCKGYENNYKPKVDNSDTFEDVCEWKQDHTFNGLYKTCRGYVTYLKDFKYCPYCSKKIKVV